MRIQFHTLAIRGAEEDSILLHSKTLHSLFGLLSNHIVYETIMEDLNGNTDNVNNIEMFIEQYAASEYAQFELKLYSNQTISF